MLDQLASFLLFNIVASLFDKDTTFRRHLSTVLNQTAGFEILDEGGELSKLERGKRRRCLVSREVA